MLTIDQNMSYYDTCSRVEMKQLLRSSVSWNIVRDAGSVENLRRDWRECSNRIKKEKHSLFFALVHSIIKYKLVRAFWPGNVYEIFLSHLDNSSISSANFLKTSFLVFRLMVQLKEN